MSREQRILVLFVAMIGLLLALSFTWLWGFRNGRNSVRCPVIEKTDTLWRTVTRYVDRPVEVIKWRDREKLVYIPVRDTTIVNDTTYVVLPREYKVYQDSTYSAQVSGIDPALDWIKFNQQAAYITNTVIQRKRLGFSITVGPTVLWNGKVQAGIGAAAGLSWTF